MLPEDARAADIPLHLAFSYERDFLCQLWGSADEEKAVTIVALDLETSYRAQLHYITELGLSSQPMGENNKRVTRHILVDSNQNKKLKCGFTPPGFGVKSEHVNQQHDLYWLLEDALKAHNPPKHNVVLTGFAVHNDLSTLFRTINWWPPRGIRVIDAQHVWASFFLPPTPRSKLSSLEHALADFEIPLESLASPHNPANDAWYSIEMLVRRAEQAVGPVTIKVPPSKARVPPPVATPAKDPASAIPPWPPTTCKPANQNSNRRKSGSRNTVSNNPNLIPLDPAQDRLSRKRKVGDRYEEDGPSTPVATVTDRESEYRDGGKDSPNTTISNDRLQELLQKPPSPREENLVELGAGKASQKQPGGPSDLAAEDVSVSATLYRERFYGES